MRLGRIWGPRLVGTFEGRIDDVVDDPVYRANFKKRAIAGELAPALEMMLWHYAKGKPVERSESGAPGDFSKLSDAELKVEMLKAMEKL